MNTYTLVQESLYKYAVIEETITMELDESVITELMQAEDLTHDEAVREVLFDAGTTTNERILSLENFREADTISITKE